MLLLPPVASVLGEIAIADGEESRPNQASAVTRNDGASQALADENERTAAAVAVAAFGQVVVEETTCDGCGGPHLADDSTPLGTPDTDDVGPRGGGIIAAYGLVVAKAAARGSDARGEFSINSTAEGVVHERIVVAWTGCRHCFRPRPDYGRNCRPCMDELEPELVLETLMAPPGATADKAFRATVTADGSIVAKSAVVDDSRSDDFQTAASAAGVAAIVRSAGQVAADGRIGDRGSPRLDVDAAAECVPEW